MPYESHIRGTLGSWYILTHRRCSPSPGLCKSHLALQDRGSTSVFSSDHLMSASQVAVTSDTLWFSAPQLQLTPASLLDTGHNTAGLSGLGFEHDLPLTQALTSVILPAHLHRLSHLSVGSDCASSTSWAPQPWPTLTWLFCDPCAKV